MKALVFEGPWQMPLLERDDPRPGRGEVVVAIRASGICGSDVHGYVGSTGRRKPGVVMGHEAAGEVVAVGDDVTTVRVGDHVALRSILPCGVCETCRSGQPNICPNRRGLGMHIDGAYADLVVVPEQLAFTLPPGLGFRSAALIEPLAVAMHAVALTPLAAGARVAIVGAGAIGLLTLLAVRPTAGAIVVSDRSGHRLELAARLGADATVHVGRDDLRTRVLEVTDGRGADVVFEAVGITATVQGSIAAARAGGAVTWIGNSQPTVELPMQDVVTRELTIRGAYGSDEEFGQAADALAGGQIDATPLIEHVAPLDDGPALFRALGEGRLDAAKVILAPRA